MKTDLKLGGTFFFEHVRDGNVIDSWEEDNLVVNEGLDYVLDTSLSGGTGLVSWYIGLFTGDYTPVASLTAATITAASTETQAQYSEGFRQDWVDAGVSGQSLGNTASPATFTFTPASTLVYGTFLVSDATKGGTTGTLMSASRFTSARTMLSGDVLNVTYSISAAAA